MCRRRKNILYIVATDWVGSDLRWGRSVTKAAVG
jgi:hypothetical protein